ncbi:MAG: ISL3 family transposase [Fibrobacteria bacterium]|nr:ISL3 family transposase [Fibrobacteria bacterium]
MTRHGFFPCGVGEKTSRCGCCGHRVRGWYDQRDRLVRDLDLGPWRIWLRIPIRRVFCTRCQSVKTERIEFLADVNRYTDRYALWVGRQCREKSVKAVAVETGLSWDTVKDLDKLYMAKQLEAHPRPAPRWIGLDEIAIASGHSYRVIVHDLEHKRPIWVGERKGRGREAVDDFFQSLTASEREGIELAVMDMYGPYRTSLEAHCPNAAVHYDHFHLVKNLGDAVDKIRKAEYKRLEGDQRRYIKGTKYILLSHRENLDPRRRKALDELLQVNRRLNKAYLLKESFRRIWTFKSPAWARKFFDEWRSSLRWQRLQPLEKFADLVESHWDGIVRSLDPKCKVPMGFVEGMNAKIRAIQKRAYGLRDEDYLRLKILTSTLPRL